MQTRRELCRWLASQLDHESLQVMVRTVHAVEVFDDDAELQTTKILIAGAEVGVDRFADLYDRVMRLRREVAHYRIQTEHAHFLRRL
jgi:hypothetical protein